VLGQIDTSKELIKPKLYLCKPDLNRTVIAPLKEAYNVRFHNKLGAISELTFDLPVEIEDEVDLEVKLVKNPHLDLIKGRYLIKMILDEKEDWFIINKPSSHMNDSNDYKSYQAFSLAYELRDKSLRRYNVESYNATQVLTDALSLTNWDIGYIDVDFDSTYRQFDISKKSILDFILDEISKAFNALVVFDNVNRKVSLYKPKNIGNNKGLKASLGNLLKSLDVEINIDEIVTRLYAFGKDDLSIQRLNATGSTYLENLSWFLLPVEVDKSVESGKIKSGNIFPGHTMDINKILSDVEELNLNTVNVPVKIDFADTTTSTMSVNQTSKQDAITLIQSLNDKGIDVILEPYPWVATGESETEINPSDVNAWFYNWKTIVLQELIDDIVNPYNVYALNTSSNLVKLEPNTGYWQDVFSFVKGLYTGNVTYRTNWWVTAVWDTGAGSTTEAYNDKLNNALFGDVNLDFISISAYFELNPNNYATISELKADLLSTTKFDRQQNVYQEVKNFYTTWGKPIFFGELGAPSRELAASEPWNNAPSTIESESIQANIFKAYEETFDPETWFMGFSIFHIGFQESTTTYHPVGKIAEFVVEDWYGIDTVVQSSDFMNDGLCLAQFAYNNLLELKNGEFEYHLNKLEAQQDILTTKNNELTTLQTELEIIKDDLETANYSGTDNTLIIQDKNNKEAEIQAKKDEIASVQATIDQINSDINALNNQVATENNFTVDQIKERNQFIIYDTFENQNYIVDTDLYNDTKEKLEEISIPPIVANVSVVNFLEIIEEQHKWEKLVLGDTLTLSHDKLDISIQAQIAEIQYDYENGDIALTISNVKEVLDDEDKVLRDISSATSASTTINMNQFKIGTIDNQQNDIKQIYDMLLGNVANEVNVALNEDVSISKRGIIIKDKNDPLKQIIIQSGRIVLSVDGGNNWQTAITGEHIVAERIVGLLGEFAQLRANQLVVGDAGEIIDDSLVNAVKPDTPYNKVYITTANGVQVKDINSVERLKMGDLGNSQYGFQTKDASGNVKAETRDDGTIRLVDGELVLNDGVNDRIFIGKDALGNYLFKINDGNGSATFTTDSTGKVRIVNGELEIAQSFGAKTVLDSGGLRVYHTSSDYSKFDYSGFKRYINGQLTPYKFLSTTGQKAAWSGTESSLSDVPSTYVNISGEAWKKELNNLDVSLWSSVTPSLSQYYKFDRMVIEELGRSATTDGISIEVRAYVGYWKEIGDNIWTYEYKGTDFNYLCIG
jgi:hypothetical protein